jgi:glycosyltransferase involved in cell wall biosynthesis
MRTLLINASDGRGGAARAVYRLHQGLGQAGINSTMLVQTKRSADISVIGPNLIVWKGVGINYIFRYMLDKSPLLVYPGYQKTVWSPQWLPNRIHMKINRLNPDIVHFHWICDGFVPVQEVAKIKQPLIWTLHDMWPFTGGCHYTGTCDRYMYECGKCPQLGSDKEKDLSHWVWTRKKNFWMKRDFTVVTPSRWLANCARSSSLFQDKKVEVIPNGLDLQKFKPINRLKAKEDLNLPLDKNLILFGAMKSTKDKRKGFQYLKSALNVLSEYLDFEAIVFGNSDKYRQLNSPIKYMGNVPDTMLTKLYSAADVFVAPSVEENLSNTVMESLACGTPCVAFNIGGMSDMIVHKENGYLAKPFDTDDLAEGIEWIVDQDQKGRFLRENSRKYVEKNFDLKSIAKKYIDLYSRMLM